MPEKINLNEERFILAYGFRGFSLWLLDLVAFGPVMVEVHDRRKLLTLAAGGKQRELAFIAKPFS
jgi:hypothetical protein